MFIVVSNIEVVDRAKKLLISGNNDVNKLKS